MLGSTTTLLGKQVLNGCGATLGRVIDVIGEADGSVREIVVRQSDESKDWIVDAIHIKLIAQDIVLKGPREGFHIAPLQSTPAPVVVLVAGAKLQNLS